MAIIIFSFLTYYFFVLNFFLLLSFVYLQVQRITERLSEEALKVRLRRSGYMEPLYISSTLSSSSGVSSSSVPSFLSMVKVIKLDGYKDFHTMVLKRVCRENCRQSDIDYSYFRTVSYLSKSGPLLHESTALQIGLINNENVPDLIKYLLPKNAPSYCKSFLRQWLLVPPPFHIGIILNELNKELINLKISLPYIIILSIGKVTTLLSEGQANAPLFRDIISIIESVLIMLQGGKNNGYLPLNPHLITLTSYINGIKMDPNIMLIEGPKIINRINSLIISSNQNYDNNNNNNVDDYNSKDGITRFFEENEKDFRSCLSPLNEKVNILFTKLEKLSNSLREKIIEQFPPIYGINEEKPLVDVEYDIYENEIFLYFKYRKVSDTPKSNTHNVNYIEVGKALKSYKRFTTPDVKKLTAEYLDMNEEVRSEALKLLRELCKDLVGNLVEIQHATTWIRVLHVSTP